MKKMLFYVIVGLILIGIVAWDTSKGFEIFLKNDYKMAMISPQGLGLISVSSNRGMINFLVIGPEVMVWVPRGYGWYKADRIYGLLKQEDRMDLASEIMFFNFGNNCRKIIWGDDLLAWEEWGNMVNHLGVLPSIYLKWRMSEMFFNEEVNNNQLVDNVRLDEVLSREFSEDRLIEEDIKVSVFNATGSNLLATFVAEKLNWLGINVLTVGDNTTEMDECILKYGIDVEKSKTFSVIRDIFSDCQVSAEGNILAGEMELVLGRKWSQMINYDSYVRSF